MALSGLAGDTRPPSKYRKSSTVPTLNEKKLALRLRGLEDVSKTLFKSANFFSEMVEKPKEESNRMLTFVYLSLA